MEKWQIIALLLLGLGLLVGSVLLRIYSQGKYEIKTIDLVFIVVPLLVAGLATGKLRDLDMFGVKADLSDLWTTAADTKIERQVSAVPVSDAVTLIRPAMKGGVSAIPRLIQERTEALAFRLGAGTYYGPAIKKYFDDLYGSSYLRHVVINESDGALFGMYNAADLIAFLRTQGDAGYRQFERMLNEGDQQGLARLPGFIPADRAVTARTSKRDALQAMEDQRLDSLPVVDANRRFIGTVERAKLTAGLILTVTKKLSDEQGADGN